MARVPTAVWGCWGVATLAFSTLCARGPAEDVLVPRPEHWMWLSIHSVAAVATLASLVASARSLSRAGEAPGWAWTLFPVALAASALCAAVFWSALVLVEAG